MQAMVDANRLREQPANRTSVAAVWQKAVDSARDAELPGMSVDGSLRAAYDAGHLAALALLAAHGLRPGGGPGHHEMAFAGAAALGGVALADLVPDSAEVRGLRKGSMYDPVIAGPAEQRPRSTGCAGRCRRSAACSLQPIPVSNDCLSFIRRRCRSARRKASTPRRF